MSYHKPNTTAICKQCGKEFAYYKAPCVAIRQFCSNECFGISIRKGWEWKSCPICGKNYLVKKTDKNYAKKTACSIQCTRKLNRLENGGQIRQKLIESGFIFWTDERRQILVENYPIRGTKWCAEQIGRSISSIESQVHILGLKRDPDILRTEQKLANGLMAYFKTKGHPSRDPEIVKRMIKTRRERYGDADRQKLMAATRRLRLTHSSKLQEGVRSRLLDAGFVFEYEYLLDGNFVVDIAFLKEKLVLQIDGCYWHGHKCRKEKLTDRQISQTRRDKSQDAYCKAHGWIVLRIWECEIEKHWDECFAKIITALNN